MPMLSHVYWPLCLETLVSCSYPFFFVVYIICITIYLREAMVILTKNYCLYHFYSGKCQTRQSTGSFGLPLVIAFWLLGHKVQGLFRRAKV